MKATTTEGVAMTVTEKKAAIMKFFLHHIEAGMEPKAAVTHIATGLGITEGAVAYAVKPILEAGEAVAAL